MPSLLESKMTKSVPNIDQYRAPLAHAIQALESSRDSGYDLSASAGEIVDNSLEAHATVVRIRMIESADETKVEQIAFADDGDGITPDILAFVLSLGYSARYGSREGYGRFGMGLKLASLAQGECVEIYTRPKGDAQIYRTILSMRDVRSGTQDDLRVEAVGAFPDEFADLMTNPDTGDEFVCGTLVIWRDIDRLPTEKNPQRSLFDESLNKRRVELERYLARTYRVPLSEGKRIELDGKVVDLYDPTFQLPSPRMVRQFGEDLRSTEVQKMTIPVNGHDVEVIVTLAPLATRKVQGQGGTQFKELYFDVDHARAITMLRNGREIYYDVMPKLLPGSDRNNDLDRFIGVEIRFPAALDEYFQVRNVKRGAAPVQRLRDQIRNFVKLPVEDARKQIRADWLETEREVYNSPVDKNRERVTAAAERAAETMPPGQANMQASPEEVEEVLREVAEDLGVDPDSVEGEPMMEQLRLNFAEREQLFSDGRWPGGDMFEIRHLSGKFVLKFNHRHAFIAEVYDAVKNAVKRGAESMSVDDVQWLIDRFDIGLDALLLAYARAENQHPNADEVYSQLRTYWGTFAAAYIKEGLTD